MDPKLNYSNWKKDHKSILESLPGKKIVTSYTGGKDSSIILDFILRAGKEFGFDFRTYAVLFPHHVFTDIDKNRLDSYWGERGVSIVWHEISETDRYLDDALKKEFNPCSTCSQIKRNFFINYLKNSITDWKPDVIIMSYSLWDIVSATIEHTLGTIYSIPGHSNLLRGKKPEERFIETSQRFYPLLKLQNGLTIFKPLIKYNDQDILDAVSEVQIPLVLTPCRYEEFRPKRLFATYYEKLGLKFEYDKVFEFAKKALNLPDISYYEQIGMKDFLNKMI